MERCLNARVDNGVDTLLKVVGVLRRKEFDVSDVSMTSLSESKSSNLLIRLGGQTEKTFFRAKEHLEKIVGVSEIVILEEEM